MPPFLKPAQKAPPTREAAAQKAVKKPKMPRRALTLRFREEEFTRIELLARAQNRSPTNLVETVVLERLTAEQEAARVITVYVADELRGVTPGELVRSEGESDERYARRSALLSRLFATGDNAD